MGAYRLQAQLKVRDSAVAHPSGVTSARIDIPMHYCSWRGWRSAHTIPAVQGRCCPATAQGRWTGKYSIWRWEGREMQCGWHQGKRELAF